MIASLVIPVYNGRNIIGRCIDSLLSQNYPKNKFEIIIVDDGSLDDTSLIAKKFKSVRVIRQKHAGPAVARNLGISKAKGKIVVFTDADCVPDKNWLREMLKPFEDPDVAGVAGTYRTLNRESVVARFVGYEISQRHERMKKFRSIDFIGTYSAAYRKNVLDKFSFDESFPMASGEDPDLSFRIAKSGRRLVFNPKAFVYHSHVDSIGKYLKQKFWRGYWRILLYKKHPEKIYGESYTPSGIILQTLLSGILVPLVLLAPFNAIASYAAIATLLLIFAMNLGFYAFVFSSEFSAGLLSMPLSLMRNFAYGFGIVAGVLRTVIK